MGIPTLTYRRQAAQSWREELILAHLPLVRHVLGKLVAHFPPGVDVENLEAAGTLGLVEAAHKFDRAKGVQFKSYAFLRIRGAMLDELRRNSPLPQQMQERVSRLRKACDALPGRATVAELAERTGLSPDEVADGLSAMRLMRLLSLEDADEAGPLDLDGPGEQAERAERNRLLAQAITALPQRDRLVVSLYYLEGLPLKEIGRLLGLSESRVSRVLSAALFALGDYLRAREA